MLKNKHYSLYVLNNVAIIKEHIDKDPFEFKTSKELVEALTTVNEKLVEKAFKDIYGHGVKTYLVKRRLDASKNHLIEGISVKLVASKCFYKSQSAYSTAFKKEFGITPREWMEKLSKEATKALSNPKS